MNEASVNQYINLKRSMIIQHTNKKSALYCKSGSNNPYCKHRNRIIIVVIFNTVVIMLVFFLALVRNKVEYSFVSTLNISYTLSFVFRIELEGK
jgi:hypothetical protein